LIASELFGHEKGAFTGAVERRVGRFETADGGTLLLDEIGDLPPETQIALLRVLQEREFERVGNVNPIPIDVRVLAATNKDLAAAVASGTFRQDLYYRLNVFPVSIPPLRERTDDIPLLVEYLIERYAKKAGKKITNIERSTLELLKAYDWPGNVRELQNVIERGVILCETATFSVDESWFGRDSKPGGNELVPLSTTLTKNERDIIEKALAESAGQVGGANGAAARLGIARQTLDSKIKLLGINKFHYKKP
jgi:formate hydrogenlyase transcriptional activator